MREDNIKGLILVVCAVCLVAGLVYVSHKDTQRQEWCQARCYPLLVEHCEGDFVLCAGDKVFRKDQYAEKEEP